MNRDGSAGNHPQAKPHLPYHHGATGKTLLALLVLLPLWWLASSWYRQQLISELRSAEQVKLALLGNTLTTSLNRHLAKLSGLYAFTLANPGAAELEKEFPTFAAGLYAGSTGIRNLGVAPGGILKHVYPMVGNENALGHDLLHDPHLSADIRRALDTRVITLSGPYELRQGGLGLVARRALYLNDTLWGFVTIVLDIPPLLTEAGLSTDSGSQEIALRASSGTVFFGDSRVFASEPVLQRIELPEGSWELAAVPREGWSVLAREQFLIFQGVAMLICGLLALLTYLTASRQELLSGAVAERTRELTKKNEELHREIVDRQATENALRESRSHLSTLLELSPVGLALCRIDGTLVNVNPAFARIIGRTTEETLALSYWDITPKKYADAEQSQLKSLEMTGRYGPYEKEYIHRDGHLVPVLLSGLIVERDSERFIWSCVEDISAQKQVEIEQKRLHDQMEREVIRRTAELDRKRGELQESRLALLNLIEDLNEKTRDLEKANVKLQEVDRLKSMFIAMMSHELRTPLNSIIGFTSILLNEWVGPLNDEQKENLSTVLRSGRHLLALINDVIDVSKIEAGQIEIFSETFDLHDLVVETVATLDKEIVGKGLELRVANVHQEITSDRRRLFQVLLNLLSNAVKYTERGWIGLAVEPETSLAGSELVKISVEDTGIGISGKDRTHIFEPFIRLDSHLKATVPGTGLGLYLTRKLVNEILGGEITFSSEPGKGSRFELILPVLREGA